MIQDLEGQVGDREWENGMKRIVIEVRRMKAEALYRFVPTKCKDRNVGPVWVVFVGWDLTFRRIPARAYPLG